MSNDFWNDASGADIRDSVDADKDLPSGDFTPIPDKTKVLVSITEAGIKTKDGNRSAYAIMEVIKPEAYARRKLFPGFWIYDDNPHAADKAKKRSNDMTRFVKLDAACGGKLARKGGIPDGDDIALAFTGKQVIAHVMLMTPKDGGEPFNWYGDYWPKGSKELTEVAAPAAKPNTGGSRGGYADDMDSDIPF